MQTESLSRPSPAVNSKQVRILLIEHGMRQVDLARRWGVSRSAVSQVIYGKRPKSKLLKKLTEALKVSLEEICDARH